MNKNLDPADYIQIDKVLQFFVFHQEIVLYLI